MQQCGSLWELASLLLSFEVGKQQFLGDPLGSGEAL